MKNVKIRVEHVGGREKEEMKDTVHKRHSTEKIHCRRYTVPKIYSTGRYSTGRYSTEKLQHRKDTVYRKDA